MIHRLQKRVTNDNILARGDFVNANKIGQFIKDLRCEKNLTQKDLAQKISCTDKAISRWETGKGMPEISYLVSLAEVFEISVDELLKGERVMEENINKDTNELVKDLVPVVNNQIKRTKKQTFREAFAGILCSFVIWILGFFISGGYFIIDSGHMFNSTIAVFFYPFFIMAFCICLALFSAKHQKENFYNASIIVLFVPIISGILIIPFSLLGLDGLIMIAFIFMVFAWPLLSLFGGVSEMLERVFDLYTYNMLNTIITVSIVLIPIIIGIVASILIYKKNKEHLG